MTDKDIRDAVASAEVLATCDNIQSSRESSFRRKS